MRLIDPFVSLVLEEDPFKKIERVGRTCYKSEENITEDSAKKFYDGLVKRSHTAMLEHATFVFEVEEYLYKALRKQCHKYLNFTDYNCRYLVSGNLRAINESNNFSLLKALYFIDPSLVYNDECVNVFWAPPETKVVNIKDLACLSEEEFMAHAYFTFHFICDRGVTHEMVRHRPASYAQESTRYCNYTKAKFGGDITYIKPAGWDSLPYYVQDEYINSFIECEDRYCRLISYGQTPQQARAVLPNALKTEIIMTANAKEFEHFFNLRSRGTTGAPHPDMKVVADMALALYECEKKRILKNA